MGEMADDLIEGFTCSWCGTCFVESHGYPVICQSCYQNWKKEDKRKRNTEILLQKYGLQLATNMEL